MSSFSNASWKKWQALGALLLLVSILTGRAALLPPEQTLYDVTFAEGTFVAVGANGTIFSSVNGGEWILRPSGVTNELRAVAFGGGVFVAAGANGTLVSSTNGIAWTVRSITAVLSSPDVAFGNGRFVVGGRGPAGFWTMLVSTNGIDWLDVNVDAPTPPFSNGMPLNGLTFGAGKFLAVGGVINGNLILASTDGVAWSEQGLNGPSGMTAGPVTFGDGRFVMTREWYDDDDDDGGPYQNLIVSDDGMNWRWTYSPSLYRHQAIAAADCSIVLSTVNPYVGGLPSTIWYSHDQSTWNQLTGNGSVINGLAFGNGQFVGVGNDIVPLSIPPPIEAFPVVPAAQFIQIGQYAYFQAGTPCLDPPVRYQWRLNGTNIPGETNLNYYLYSTSLAQAGNYTLVASNASGSITSTVATLSIQIPPETAPAIISPAADTTNILGLGQDWSLNVGANGWPYPSYQWRLNGVDIPGATNAYLPIYNASPAANGDYTAVASNPLGVATSPIQRVIVSATSAPSYSLGEQNVVVTEGSRVSFPYVYYYNYSAPPENYLVLKNGVNIGWPIDQLYAPYFTLRKATLSDSGQYVLIASNSAGAITNVVVSLTVTPGGPLDRWTQRNPLPQNDTLMKVSHASGQFIAIGDRGAVVSSPDGTNWTSQRLPLEVGLAGVVRDGSRFVAVGGRSILVSSDGERWTAAMSRFDLALQAVAHGNSRFVAVGGDNIVTYTDALGWRDATLTPTAFRNLRDVAFGNGRWVAVGAANGGYVPALWTSANGINWEPAEGPRSEFESVLFANGQFLATGDDGDIFTSPDGLNWTPRNSTVSSRLIGAAYGNGRFVVVGTRGRILSSATGTSWARETSGTPDRLESVTFGNGVFVAVGENGTTLSSVNGSTWIKRSRGATRDLDGMVVGNGIIAVAGKGGTLLTSSNGVDFVEQSTGVTNDLHGIGWGNGLYVAVGEPGAIITSPNAVQWTSRTSGSVSSLKSVASGGGRWVAVGTQGEILTSTDGSGWAPAVSPTANDLNGVAFGNGLYVAVGDNLPPNGTLLTSPNGLNWTRRNQYIGKNLRSVTFANGTFLATANDGVLIVSSNGLTWEPRFTGFNPNYSGNLRAAAYAKGTWTVSGNQGGILTSTDTLNWNQHTLQTAENLHGIVFFNGSFVTMGNRGTIFQSDYFALPARLAAFTTPAGFALSLTGEIGVTYRVESTDHLPSTEWGNIGSFTLTQPTTNFLVTPPAGQPQQFYRAVAP